MRVLLCPSRFAPTFSGAPAFTSHDAYVRRRSFGVTFSMPAIAHAWGGRGRRSATRPRRARPGAPPGSCAARRAARPGSASPLVANAKVTSIAKLVELLNSPTIPDVATLTRLLATKVNNIEELADLVQMIGGKLQNLAELEQLLNHAKLADGAELLQLLRHARSRTPPS